MTREVTRSYRDQVTGQIVTETTKDYASPDWKAAAWFLERQQRGHFGKPTEQVEVSGPGGGPVQGELGAAGAAELAARLGAVLAERAEGEAQALALTAGPADEVVDAVIDD